jgi:hypothetical protein
MDEKTLKQLIEALRAAQELHDLVLPRMRWDRCHFDAHAIRALRDTPAKVRAALRKAGY